jgi:hypothetical protein
MPTNVRPGWITKIHIKKQSTKPYSERNLELCRDQEQVKTVSVETFPKAYPRNRCFH